MDDLPMTTDVDARLAALERRLKRAERPASASERRARTAGAVALPAGALLLGLASLAALLYSPAAAADPGPAPARRLPSESGRVAYRIAGRGLAGTLVLSWAEHGRKYHQRVRAVDRRAGAAVRVESWVVVRGGAAYWKPPSGHAPGLLIKSPVAGGEGGVAINSAGLPWVRLGPWAGKASGRGTVLGKPCAIHALHGTQGWLWNGLLLKTRQRAGAPPPVDLVATELDTGARPPESLFALPRHLRIVRGRD